MATAAYLAAAKQATEGKREPVLVVRVEDVATLEEVYTTKADWEGSFNLTNIDTSEIIGSAVNIRTMFSDIIGYSVSSIYTAISDNFINYSFLRCVWPKTYGQSVIGRIRVIVGGIYYYSSQTIIMGVDLGGGTTAYIYDGGMVVDVSRKILNGENVTLGFQILISGVWTLMGLSPPVGSFIYTINETASIMTSTIDIGSSPVTASRFEVDDIKPTGASITYTAYADDFDPPTTSRGTVVDGDTIGAVGYRYYRIKADFATSNGARGVLQEIRIIGGDTQYITFSTHKNIPSFGALPLLPANPVGNLSSKIELDKPTSVGELSFKLLWTKASGDMLATGYLRNKAIQIQHGFVGLSSTDFETIFTGIWANYKADHAQRIIDVSTQNVLKRFMKVKLPRETFNAGTGAKETVPLTWSGINAVQVILDLVEELETPDRYLDRTTIEGLRDGALASTDYNVTRTITKPEEAWKLIHELATGCGCFVVVLPDGKVSLVLYDASATPVTTLDARYVDFGPINGGQDQLFTRQLIYYDPNVAAPGESEEDYDKGLLAINGTSETAYEESTEHRWFDKWNFSTTVMAAMADRWDSWQGTPRFTLSAKKVSNHLITILEGQIVWVTGLTVPVAAADFDTPQKFKALVTKRAFNPSKCTLDFELLQISDAESV